MRHSRGPETAPPHTRGSTHRAGRREGACRGSPAHAGIDREFFVRTFSRNWLPRTRGDRPPYRPGSTFFALAPPHTRGSTRRDRVPHARARGSPAHAGIDRAEIREIGACEWLPRTRGDRPLRKSKRATGRVAPPHTRGSTPIKHGSVEHVAGSPAHAGIDPRFVHRRRGAGRLPRTRGDRPRCERASPRPRRAPPHTRGPTARDVEAERAALGSPAHAGIDRVLTSTSAQGRRLPRTRGDRPQTRRAWGGCPNRIRIEPESNPNRTRIEPESNPNRTRIEPESNPNRLEDPRSE